MLSTVETTILFCGWLDWMDDSLVHPNILLLESIKDFGGVFETLIQSLLKYFMGFARVPSINLSKSLKFQEFYSLFTLQVGSSNPLFSTTFIMSCLCLFVTFWL